MAPYPSAQTDRFVHDHLPPADQWPELRYDLPELQALPAQLNVVQALFDRAFAAGHAYRPLFRSDERTLSYAQARAEVNRFANVLAELGLQPGNRVLLRGGNSVAMALAWLAVVQSGLIAVATMPLLRATELKAIIDKAQPSLLKLWRDTPATRPLPAPPAPTTSRCWPSPLAPPAARRPRCTRTATCWPPAKPGRATCCAPPPKTSS